MVRHGERNIDRSNYNCIPPSLQPREVIKQHTFCAIVQRVVVGFGFWIREQFSLERGHLTQQRVIDFRITLLAFDLFIASTMGTKSKALVAFEGIKAQFLEKKCIRLF